MHFVLMVILVYIILEDKSWYIAGQFFFIFFISLPQLII